MSSRSLARLGIGLVSVGVLLIHALSCASGPSPGPGEGPVEGAETAQARRHETSPRDGEVACTGASCTSLAAAAYERGDLAQAALLLRKGCEADREQCLFLAGLHAERGDEDEARAVLGEVCRRGDYEVCSMLGVELLQLRPPAADEARALLAHGCENEHPDSCHNLGVAHERGYLGVPSPALAAPFYDKACALGHAAGCQNLGVLYARGEGVVGSTDRAVELYERACEMGMARSCADLGDRLFKGRGVPRDEAAAMAYLERGCATGDGYGCFFLGQARFLTATTEEARRAAMSAMEQACDAGSGRACQFLGDHATDEETDYYERAARHFGRRCHEGRSGRDCGLLGRLYRRGKGVPRDPEEAARLVAKGCDLDGRVCGW